jgi:hypothetical protein
VLLDYPITKENFLIKEKYLKDKLTINNDEDIFVCLVFVGVLCFSRPLNVFGIVDIPEGNEHLIPENFSKLCIDRR